MADRACPVLTRVRAPAAARVRELLLRGKMLLVMMAVLVINLGNSGFLLIRNSD